MKLRKVKKIIKKNFLTVTGQKANWKIQPIISPHRHRYERKVDIPVSVCLFDKTF